MFNKSDREQSSDGKGSGRLTSLVLGAITYRIIIAFVLKLGMPANDLKLFTAITVAIALSTPRIKASFNQYRKTKKEAKKGA